MLQAVTALVSMLVGAIAIGVIMQIVRDEADAIRAALGMDAKLPSLAPLPPRFREVTVRRGPVMRLAPPARVRVAL